MLLTNGNVHKPKGGVFITEFSSSVNQQKLDTDDKYANIFG